ncbi:MAG: tetratricopeptide repeat protein [Pseudomonadota bacterium]
MKPQTQSHYTLRRVQELLGISRGSITRLIAAGFVAPSRGERRQYLFSLHDLMLLRMAQGLEHAGIAPRKILSALHKLKASLPAELPLTGLHISALGTDVVVRERESARVADSGQLLFDFEVTPRRGSVAFLAPRADRLQEKAGVAAEPAPGQIPDAESLLALGLALEDSDAANAEQAYRHALAAAPEHVDAYLHLGTLLCNLGRCPEAVAVYEQGLTSCEDCSFLLFNEAIALEDLGQSRKAAGRYERCLELDPQFADAHYNLGLLLEKLGDKRGALRHFSAYRRLGK